MTNKHGPAEGGIRSHPQLNRREVAEARDGLQRVLEAVARGELAAGGAYTAGLEGAIAALDALLERP